MAEVQRREVDEVHDQQKLSPPKMTADEEHYEGKCEEVVEDEVRSDRSSSLDIMGIGREHMPLVSDLEDEENNPVD